MHTQFAKPVANPGRMPDLLPVVIREENPRNFSVDEMQARFGYCRMMAKLYLNLFNNPYADHVDKYWNGDVDAAQVYYQERCEYFQTRVFALQVTLSQYKKKML